MSYQIHLDLTKRLSLVQLIGVVAASVIVLNLIIFTARGIYNVYIHPLRRVPGPKWSAFSELQYCRTLLQGNMIQELKNLHGRYGPVVRVAPNEVSFASVDSWKTIYGFKAGQKEGYEKDMHFFPPPINGTRGIIIATGSDHGQQRRVFSHAFSDSALRDQQPLITKYVDILLDRLHEQVDSPGKGVVDFCMWYNYLTFDVIAELSFGESFHCLENAKLHPLIVLIFAALKATTFNNAQQRLSWLKFLVGFFVPIKVLRQRKDLKEFVHARVTKRLASDVARSDFLTPASGMGKAKALEFPKIVSTSVVFMIAGSETTATTLSASTYLALRHPPVWEKLVKEVRSSFESVSDISFETVTSRLPYMLAVLNETLRLYPPIPTGFGREVPEGGDMISGYFIPRKTSVYVTQYIINRSPEYFRDPEEFHPERWLGAEKYQNDNFAAFNPFSAGPRSCLGKNLAVVEMRLALAKLLWSFEMELLEDTAGQWMRDQKLYTLWDKPPLKVRLTRAERL